MALCLVNGEWSRGNALKRRHHPQRSCLGCGERGDKKAFLRLVAQGNGELVLDWLGKGRGGYLHKTEKCWEAFLRKKSLYRAFRMEIGREAREKLIRTLRNLDWH